MIFSKSISIQRCCINSAVGALLRLFQIRIFLPHKPSGVLYVANNNTATPIFLWAGCLCVSSVGFFLSNVERMVIIHHSLSIFLGKILYQTALLLFNNQFMIFFSMGSSKKTNSTTNVDGSILHNHMIFQLKCRVFYNI